MNETQRKRAFARAAKADGYDLDDPAEAVTLAAFVVGPNVRRIARFLGRSERWCQKPARILRSSGLWHGARIVVDDDGPGVDGVTVAMQCLVAKGMLERVES